MSDEVQSQTGLGSEGVESGAAPHNEIITEMVSNPSRPPSPWNIPGGLSANGIASQMIWGLSEVSRAQNGDHELQPPRSWEDRYSGSDEEDDVASVNDSAWADVEPTARNLVPRTMDSLRTLGRELTERGQRVRRFGSLGVAAITQVPDRMRLMAVALPTVFDEVLEVSVNNDLNGYETATLAAVAVGGTWGVWSEVIGRTLRRSIDNFPGTTKRVVDNHPVMVKVLQDSIDGFPAQEDLEEAQPEMPDEGYEVGPYETRETRFGKFALATTRGLKTAFLYGTTPHVGLAEVGQHNTPSVNKRINATSIESGVVLAGTAAGLSTLITHDALGRAQQIKDTISNEKILLGASVFFIGLAAVGNYFARRGAANHLDGSQEAADQMSQQVQDSSLGEGV